MRSILQPNGAVAEIIQIGRKKPEEIKRGQIWDLPREYAIFPDDPAPDPKPQRPWLVVSANSINKNQAADYIIIAEITKWQKPLKRESRAFDAFVEKDSHNGLDYDSFVEVILIRAIRREVLLQQTYRGSLGRTMFDVDRALRNALGWQ